MTVPFSPHLAAVPFPPISEVQGWYRALDPASGPALVDLCQAVPSYPPAAGLISHLQQCLLDPLIGRYTPDEGLPEVRAAVSDWYRRRYGAGPAPDEICLTIGASQAFWLVMGVLCREGDEVLLQAPCYFDHVMGLGAMGVHASILPFDPAAETLDLERLRRAVTPRTRAILLVTPSNPTGRVLPAATIVALHDLARERNLVLVLDETYNAFLPGAAAPHPLFADPHWSEHFVQLASFGKTFALTGFRAGALVASRRLLHEALKLQDSMVVCAPRLTQEAIRYGCLELDAWVGENADRMRQRHDRFRDAFARAGNPFALVASGGFFAWVRHPCPGVPARSVARRLVEEKRVLCLPGSAFGPGLEDYLRLAFGNLPDERIAEAVERFQTFSPEVGPG